MVHLQHMLIYAVRLAWIAAHVIVLMQCAEIDFDVRSRGRYNWWRYYVCVSTVLACVTWPELITHWFDDAWPLMMVALALRAMATVEALHHQTQDHPFWTRMIGGTFLAALFPFFFFFVLPAGRSLMQFVGARRYINVYLGLVVLISSLKLWETGWWRWRVQDKHAVIVGVIAANYAVVSAACLACGDDMQDCCYQRLLLGSTAIETCCLVAWAFVHRAKRPAARSPSAPERAREETR
jgi:hypothetical protein